MPTTSVENYLKAILHLHEDGVERVSTTAIADKVEATPASTSAMLAKLGVRGWLDHEPYHGVQLTGKGRRMAMEILRRHRLWERFLVDQLGFEWDQVHEIAEELDRSLGTVKAQLHRAREALEAMLGQVRETI